MALQRQAYRTQLGDVSFSVAARVAMQLGRESISNSIVAISELVKNAYDADAEHVRIEFAQVDSDQPMLVIEDDGNGMTETQFRQGWMVIGTLNKREARRSSRKRRVFTGEKGLGRLGLDRLCERTVVQSFSQDEATGIELDIDWHKYEDSEKRLEEVKHGLFVIPKTVQNPITGASETIDSGTRLILFNLKDNWTREFMLELREELNLLVSPFAGINDFRVEIVSGKGWQDVDGSVGSAETLEAAEWKLVARIDEEWNVSYVMSSSQYSKVFEFKPTPWKEVVRDRDDHPRCGPLTFELYFFSRRKMDLGDLSFSKSQIETFLESNQGVRIYRDGFRVKPYGQPNGEGDWLTLSYRRQQSPAGVTARGKEGGWRVGYNQVVGAVFIERERNSELIDQTNREGIVEGSAFYDLKAFALTVVRFFELNRENFERARKELTEYEEAKDAAEKASEAATEAVEELKDQVQTIKEALREAHEKDTAPDLVSIEDLLDEVVDRVEEAVVSAQEAQSEFAQATEEQQEEFQRQKDTFANLASLGILTACFGHETLASTNLVVTNAKGLASSMKSGLFMVLPDVQATIDEQLYFVVSEAEKIETFARFTLRNLSRDKRTRTDVNLDDVVKQVFTSFDKFLREERNIEVELYLSDGLSSILAFRIDWESILINLITNAIWALRDTPAERRKIRVSVQEIENRIHIRFADSGCGLEAGTEDMIFLPTFSTKRNRRGEVIGTGMGLTIVKSFVEDYRGGSVDVVSPCDLGGAEFHIQVPVPALALRGRKKED